MWHWQQLFTMGLFIKDWAICVSSVSDMTSLTLTYWLFFHISLFVICWDFTISSVSKKILWKLHIHMITHTLGCPQQLGAQWLWLGTHPGWYHRRSAATEASLCCGGRCSQSGRWRLFGGCRGISGADTGEETRKRYDTQSPAKNSSKTKVLTRLHI